MANSATLVNHGMTWTYDERFKPLLDELLKVNLRNLAGDPRSRTVKKGPARTVFNLRFLEGPVRADLFVKHYHQPDLFDKIRYMFSSSKGVVEWQVSHEVSKRGIACPMPVAVGERRVLNYLKSCFYVTITEQNSLPLDYFLRKHYAPSDPPQRKALRQACLDEFAAFVAKLHQKGVMHGDFHPGNILIKRVTEGRARFCLLDMHSVSVKGRELTLEERIENLSQLNVFFSQMFSPADRFRFFGKYAELSGYSRDETSRYVRLIEKGADAGNRRLWSRRDDRSVKDNKYFERVRFPGVRGHVAREYAKAPMLDYLKDPDRFFHDVEALSAQDEEAALRDWDRRLGESVVGTRIMKNSRATTLVETNFSFGSHFQNIVVKRFNVRKSTSPWQRLLRQSRAIRAWKLAHSLLVRGLPTPRPLAAVEHRRFGLLRESYLVTEKILNSLNLHQVIQKKLTMPLDATKREFKQVLVVRTALLIRKLHQLNFSQRDLKAQNILVQPTGREASQMNLYLIDMDGLRQVRSLSLDLRARNLARLNASFVGSPSVTRTDRLRFLRSYLTARELAAGKLRTLWELVGKYTERKVQKWKKQGVFDEIVEDNRGAAGTSTSARVLRPETSSS